MTEVMEYIEFILQRIWRRRWREGKQQNIWQEPKEADEEIVAAESACFELSWQNFKDKNNDPIPRQWVETNLWETIEKQTELIG